MGNSAVAEVVWCSAAFVGDVRRTEVATCFVAELGKARFGVVTFAFVVAESHPAVAVAKVTYAGRYSPLHRPVAAAADVAAHSALIPVAACLGLAVVDYSLAVAAVVPVRSAGAACPAPAVLRRTPHLSSSLTPTHYVQHTSPSDNSPSPPSPVVDCLAQCFASAAVGCPWPSLLPAEQATMPPS